MCTRTNAHRIRIEGSRAISQFDQRVACLCCCVKEMLSWAHPRSSYKFGHAKKLCKTESERFQRGYCPQSKRSYDSFTSYCRGRQRMVKRAVITYLRVSTSLQGRSGLGIEAQRQMLHQFALAEDLEPVSEFVEVETGKGSDALERRPQLKAALAAAKKLR